jgi:hypothetical protein
MAIAARYYLHGILLPNGTWISQLDDCTPSSNIEAIDGYAAGAVAPTFRGGESITPKIEFTTPQVATVLGACGIWGYDMSAGNCDLYYRAAKNFGTRELYGASEHIRMRCVRGLMNWDRINAPQKGPATVHCMITPTFDGTNLPFVVLAGQALPADLAASEYYTCGPAKLNGTAIDDLESWALDLKPRMDEKRAPGDDYLSWCGVGQHDPIFTIEAGALDLWPTLTPAGLAVSAFVAYLRKRDADTATGIALATASHISLTGTNGTARYRQASGGTNSPATTSLEVALRNPSASFGHPISVSTAVAIS